MARRPGELHVPVQVADQQHDVAPTLDNGYPVRDSKQHFRRDIQGLRALAVILVIGNHAKIPGFAGGYIGVDIFFVISGYVITQLLLRESSKGIWQGLADFYSRRIRRIAPAATVTLVMTLLVAEIVLGTNVNPNLPGDVRWASLFAANFRFIATGSNYFVPGIFPSLITQYWSLAVEEQFYVFFPLILFVIARFVPAPKRLRCLTITLIFGIALSGLWSIHISSGEPTAAYYSPFTRFWELGLGCLVAVATQRRLTRTVRSERIATTVGIFLIVFALVTLTSSSVWPGDLAWLPCGGAALLIWSGAKAPRTYIAKALSIRPLVFIGDISYSLYLVHFVWLRLPSQLSTPLTGWGWTGLELIGTIATALLSYHLLENPIRKSTRLAKDRVAIVLVLLICVASSWTTALIVSRLAHL